MIFFKVIQVTTKITEVTTEQQKLPKISTNSLKKNFCPKGKKSLGLDQSSLQELEVSPRRGLYLLFSFFLSFVLANEYQ